jgi:hypothetical protein
MSEPAVSAADVHAQFETIRGNPGIACRQGESFGMSHVTRAAPADIMSSTECGRTQSGNQ